MTGSSEPTNQGGGAPAAAEEAPIDEPLIRRLADLAQIELSDSEIRRMTPQLRTIIGHIKTLSEVDIEGVAATIQVGHDTGLERADEIVSSLDRERVLAQAPAASETAFLVPAFVDEDEK